MILPHPKGTGIALLADVLGKDKEDFGDEIIKLTKEALRAQVQVRWFRGWSGNTLMIGDPDSNDAWIHVETFFPFSVAKDWPSFRVERQKQQQLFNTLKRSYLRIWDKGKAPTKMDLGSQ